VYFPKKIKANVYNRDRDKIWTPPNFELVYEMRHSPMYES